MTANPPHFRICLLALLGVPVMAACAVGETLGAGLGEYSPGGSSTGGSSATTTIDDAGLPRFDAGSLSPPPEDAAPPLGVPDADSIDAGSPPPAFDAGTHDAAPTHGDAAVHPKDAATASDATADAANDASAPDDAGVADAPSGSDAGGGGLTATLKLTSTWQNGYCASVLVENSFTDTVYWTVEIPIDGTVTSNWDSTLQITTGLWVFQGESWNNSLAPGASTTFGFCATL